MMSASSYRFSNPQLKNCGRIHRPVVCLASVSGSSQAKAAPAKAATDVKAPAKAPAKTTPTKTKAPTAFNLYMKDALKPAIAKGSPVTEAMKVVAQQWKTIKDTPQAKKYHEEAAKAKAALAEERAKLKGPPKPVSSFAFYIKDNFAAMKAAMPEAKAPEVTSKLAQKWKQLPPNLKKKYEDMAAADRVAKSKKQ